MIHGLQFRILSGDNWDSYKNSAPKSIGDVKEAMLNGAKVEVINYGEYSVVIVALHEAQQEERTQIDADKTHVFSWHWEDLSLNIFHLVKVKDLLGGRVSDECPGFKGVQALEGFSDLCTGETTSNHGVHVTLDELCQQVLETDGKASEVKLEGE